MSRVKPTLFSASDASGAVRGTWGRFYICMFTNLHQKKCCVSLPFSDKIKYAWNICKLNQTHAYALFRSVIIKARIHLHWISVDCEFWGLPLVLLELSFSSQVLCSFTSPEKDTKHRSHGDLILKQLGLLLKFDLEDELISEWRQTTMLINHLMSSSLLIDNVFLKPKSPFLCQQIHHWKHSIGSPINTKCSEMCSCGA